VKRKIIASIDLIDSKIPEEESDAIYLSHQEIIAIYQTDLSDHPYLVEYRDVFVLACLTGLRFSDFSTLKPEDLQRDMLYKKQEKSDLG
jgi:integrase